MYFVAWSMYASYYLCKLNISIAVPSLVEFLGGGSQGEKAVGYFNAAFSIAYAVGQVTNGYLADKLGPRKVATVGMILSAGMNFLFGLSRSFGFFLLFWALNGFFQATGAPSRIKVIGNWCPPEKRGTVMGFVGTDYVFGNAVAWFMSGLVLDYLGWRYIFIVPAVILLFSAMHFFIRVRNSPKDVGLPEVKEEPEAKEEPEEESRSVILRKAFLNWKVWILAFGYFGVDIFRYGFLHWSFYYLTDIGAPVGQSTLKVVMIPFFGILGILASGYLTDKMKGKRAPIVFGMLVSAGMLAILFRVFPAGKGQFVVPMVLLALIGFSLYGPHLIMGATMAIDLGSKRASATASGIIDAMGYIGVAVQSFLTPIMKEHWGWNGAFALWIGGVLLAAVLMLFLWNYSALEKKKA